MKTVTTAKSVVASSCLALVLVGAVSTSAKAATLSLNGSGVITPPFNGTGNGGNTPLTQVFGQLNQQLGSLSSYFNQIVAAKLAPLTKSLGKDINAVVSDVTGALGLPDPIQARQEVEQVASSSNSPVYSAEPATNEVDRQITRSVVDATLGQAGQQQLQQAAQQTQNSVGQVQQQAQAAQQEVVTQNVMKQMALQNGETAALLGAMRADSLQALSGQELTNLNLTNISRSLDGQNQAKQSEMVGAGQDTFKTAARARLF